MDTKNILKEFENNILEFKMEMLRRMEIIVDTIESDQIYIKAELRVGDLHRLKIESELDEM